MEFKFKNKRSLMMIIAFGIFLYWGLNHLSVFWRIFEKVLGVMLPILLGGAIAFVLNVPMRILEEKLGPFFKEKVRPLRMVSILLSFLILIGILFFVVMMVIPELINTLMQISTGIPKFLDQVNLWLADMLKAYPQIEEYLQTLEVNSIDLTKQAAQLLQNGGAALLSSTVGVASNLIGGVVSTALGFIFSIYILSQKEKLGLQFRKLFYAYLPKKAVDYFLKVIQVSSWSFSKFISGQCTEAVAFGLLCFVSMSLFRFPYAASISVFIGFMTLIPVVGAFVGTAVGAVLILVSNPLQAVWFVLLIIVLQQIDGNLIYPRIVGNSVGLPSIWVLMAVTVGGNLFGMLGMLVSVPIAAASYTLLRESIEGKLEKKKIFVGESQDEPNPCKNKKNEVS